MSFQHSNSPSSTSSSNEEKSPKLPPHNNGAVSTTPSGSTEPMRNKSLTTTPVLPKRSYDKMPSSPNLALEKRQLMSDGAICKLN